MNCCKQSQADGTGNGEHDQQTNNHSKIKHVLMMLACCLAPVGAILLLQTLGYEGTSNYLMFLICPLMHLFMMKGMGHNRQSTVSDDSAGK